MIFCPKKMKLNRKYWPIDIDKYLYKKMIISMPIVMIAFNGASVQQMTIFEFW